MIPAKDITAAVAQGDNPSDDPVSEEGRNERDYPKTAEQGGYSIQAWTCLCGQVNSYWASECGRCGLLSVKAKLQVVAQAEQHLEKVADLTGLVFEPFHPYTVNRYEIERAINWIDMGDPKQAKAVLLKALGAPVPVPQPETK